MNRHYSQLHMSTRLCYKFFSWFFSLVLDSYFTCMHYQHSAEDLQSGGWVVVCMFVEFSVQLSPVPWTLIALVPLDSAQSQTWSAFQPHLCSPSLHSSSSLETPKAVSFANPKTDLIFPITLFCYLLSSAWKQYFFHTTCGFGCFKWEGKSGPCCFHFGLSRSLS